jgi:putative SOS response-associated peptidase YedK
MPAEAHAAWLDWGNQDPASPRESLQPLPGELQKRSPVSTWVNNPRHDGPRCVEPAA